jgi:hypothetical protein
VVREISQDAVLRTVGLWGHGLDAGVALAGVATVMPAMKARRMKRVFMLWIGFDVE